MLDSIEGVIERRLLCNYAVEPAALRPLVPDAFDLDLVEGRAMAGICTIQLRVRPRWAPHAIGHRSVNLAHRIAVRTPDGEHGVYISRRDSATAANVVLGGRLFPGPHGRARIDFRRSDDHVGLAMDSRDGEVAVAFSGVVTDSLPTGSVFEDAHEASDFFRRGAWGYSPDHRGGLDCVELRSHNWSVTPLDALHASSSFFAPPSLPHGSAEFDHALLMEDIHHSWHTHGCEIEAHAASESSNSANEFSGA